MLFKKLSTTKIITLSYMAVILFGGIILTLPAMSASGAATDPIDALFTATSSVCVTGLTTLTTAAHWSLAGKVVILLLIQIGGMGTVTILTMTSVLWQKKIMMKNRLLIEDAFDLDSMQGVVRFVLIVFYGVLAIEFVGAAAYSFTFIPRYGIGTGIWYSIFHSISAFCNAGIDIIGDRSFEAFAGSAPITIITVMLIVVGGLGFMTLWELVIAAKERVKRGCGGDTLRKKLSQHAKLVLTVTFIMITAGAVLYWIFEHGNSATIGGDSGGKQALECLFQSVTTRTAGFATISQSGLTFPSIGLTVFLMFIGGSPGGTAGGIKTTTFAIMILETVSVIKGKQDVTCFHRRVPVPVIRKAFAVFFISTVIGIAAVIAMYFLQPGRVSDIIFEVYSALGTVGLSRDLTPTLGAAGKVIIILCMYIGRVGPISVAAAVAGPDYGSGLHYAYGNVRVG